MSDDDVLRSDVWLTEKAHKDALEKQKENYEDEISKLRQEIQKRDLLLERTGVDGVYVGCSAVSSQTETPKIENKKLTGQFKLYLPAISCIVIIVVIIAMAGYYRYTENMKEQARREAAIAQETPTTIEQLLQQFQNERCQMPILEKEKVGCNFIIKILDRDGDIQYLNVTEELYLSLVTGQSFSHSMRCISFNNRLREASLQRLVNLEGLRKFTVFEVSRKYQIYESFVFILYDDKNKDEFRVFLRVPKEVFDVIICGHTIGEQLPAIVDAFKRSDKAVYY